MEIINEKGLRILVAKDGCVIQSVTDGSILGKKLVLGKKGCVIQSVTDGSILGKKLILGKKDSEIHYHEIPVPAKEVEDTEE